MKRSQGQLRLLIGLPHPIEFTQAALDQIAIASSAALITSVFLFLLFFFSSFPILPAREVR